MDISQEILNDMRYYVLASELIGFDGTYHLFDNRELAAVRIHPLPNHKTLVVINDVQLTLNCDDSFCIDRYGKVAYHIRGPLSYRNDPFRALIAETVLKREVIRMQWDENLVLGRFEVAYTPPANDRYGQSMWSGLRDEEVSNDQKVVVLRCNYGNGPITRIFVRTDAEKSDLEWLRYYLESSNVMRKQSGVFQRVHEHLQDEEDESWKNWMDRVLDEIDEEFQNRYEACVKLIGRVESPTTITVEDKIFTINRGKIHKGKMVGGKSLDPWQLHLNGKLSKIVSAVIN